MNTPLQSGMIDSHFHSLIMADRGVETQSVLDEAFAAGFAGGVDVSVSPEDLPERAKLHRHRPTIRLSSGIHPGQCGRGDTDVSLELLRKQTADADTRPLISALGEMGLDYYRGKEHRDTQREVFLSQLEIARELHLPVIIHNREAEDDILSCIDKVGDVRGVMHCFSSSVDFARRCLDRDLYISFAGNLTYKGSQDIREALSIVPSDRLLLETDAPFLAPQAVRGRPNHPALVAHTYVAASDIRREDLTRMIESIMSNFLELFPSN